jgi:hypothetical protein
MSSGTESVRMLSVTALVRWSARLLAMTTLARLLVT